jgi:hypothetical protein
VPCFSLQDLTKPQGYGTGEDTGEQPAETGPESPGMHPSSLPIALHPPANLLPKQVIPRPAMAQFFWKSFWKPTETPC